MQVLGWETESVAPVLWGWGWALGWAAEWEPFALEAGALGWERVESDDRDLDQAAAQSLLGRLWLG